MRAIRLVLAVAVAVALGGSAALGLAAAAGWLGDGDDPAPVVLTTTVPDRAVAAAGRAGTDFDPARIYRERATGVVTLYAFFGPVGAEGHASQGSGFVVSPQGHILTNAHVITNAGEGVPVRAAEQLYVQFADGDRVVGDVVGWDVFDDVGVVKIDPRDHPLTPLPLGDSSRVAVGEPVAAIGSPFGEQNSLTVGVVSATRRSIDSLTSLYELPDAIQIDAPINKGNSGGPLFDARGVVIGINAQIRSQSGNGEGVGFAVPINAAKRSLEELVERGRVRYGYVGVNAEDLTPTIASHFGDAVRRGAVVASVRPGSPAARAGLRGATEQKFFRGDSISRGGDIVVEIDGVPVRSAADLVRIVAERLTPGRRAVFTVIRDGRRRRLTVLLGERPVDPSA